MRISDTGSGCDNCWLVQLSSGVVRNVPMLWIAAGVPVLASSSSFQMLIEELKRFVLHLPGEAVRHVVKATEEMVRRPRLAINSGDFLHRFLHAGQRE